MKKVIINVVVLFLVIGLVAPSVSAKSNKEQVTEINSTLSQELINTVDPYIEVKKNSFKLTNSSELKKKISQSELELVEESLLQTNTALKANKDLKKVNNNTLEFKITDKELKTKVEKAGYKYDLNPKEASTELDKDSLSFDKSSGMQLATAYKNGVNKVIWKWWGAEVWLSKTTVANIVGAGITGASVIVGSAIPGLGHAIALAANTFVLGAVYSSQYARAKVIGITYNGIVLYSRNQ